jgi:hypothetical protein
MLAGRSLAELARSHSEEAIKTLLAIGRGDIDGANDYIIHKRGRPTVAQRQQQQRNQQGAQAEAGSTGTEIPWHTRLAAWIELLNRGFGKPFQSAEVYDEKDVTISFKNPEELRAKLIENGVPASFLPTPEQLMTIDADAVRAEAERDNQELRKKRRP